METLTLGRGKRSSIAHVLVLSNIVTKKVQNEVQDSLSPSLPPSLPPSPSLSLSLCLSSLSLSHSLSTYLTRARTHKTLTYFLDYDTKVKDGREIKS